MRFVEGLFLVFAFSPVLRAVDFRRADCNGDGGQDIADAVFMLNALFVDGSPDPTCVDACDANDDGRFDIGDVIFSLNSLKTPGSPPPPFPRGTCGEDPTLDDLGCDEYTACP